MVDAGMSDDGDLMAGDFSVWMTEMVGALRGERGAAVPCAGCTACCTSSQFVPIAPDETDTLAHIPSELLFRAPRAPAGHVVLGYDERGHCPMLVDNRCSIYEHRPRTCRTYDCRVLPAAGLRLADDDDKALIDRQARRWRFAFPDHTDRVRHDAVRAAVRFLVERGDLLPAGAVPPDATHLAVLAIEVHQIFLRCDDDTGHMTIVEPDPAVLRREVLRVTGAPDTG
ncbi:MAG: uncharacterized protein V7605_1682 [Acidimicrobiaceae bacterium]|jgi:hypothetical protein